MSLRKTLAALGGAAMCVAALAACGSSSSSSSSSSTAAATTEAAATSAAASSAPAATAANTVMPTDMTGHGNGETIGITMPTKSLERWNNDGANLVKDLTAMGYKTMLDYGDNKVEQQINQIQNQINSGCKVLIIASIDGTALGNILQTAEQKGIKVIGYDRLLMNTNDIDYYVTFDNYKVGAMQGQYIVDTEGLANDPSKKINLEPFAGSPDDNNAGTFFKGEYSVLQKYIQDGQIVTPSNKMPSSVDKWASIGIQGWTTATAQNEMQNRLNSFYTDKKVDVVLSPNDSLALGIEQALDAKGYKVGTDWPLVTGQDGDLANVKNIIAGKQAMTVWKDTRKEGDAAAHMTDEIIAGQPVTTNDIDATQKQNNGVKNVPSYLLQPEVITKDNVQDMVSAGFYTAAQLGL
jgi:putative multiple sugar transport system substrate-binding protein